MNQCNNHCSRCVCRRIIGHHRRTEMIKCVKRAVVLLTTLIDDIHLMRSEILRFLERLEANNGSNCSLLAFAHATYFASVLQACGIMVRRQIVVNAMGGHLKESIAMELLRLIRFTTNRTVYSTRLARNMVRNKLERHCRLQRRRDQTNLRRHLALNYDS